MLKAIIVVLFIFVIISLSGALRFLLTDMGDRDSKYTLYALGIRISLASALLFLMFYGFYTGQLQSQAPWDAISFQ